MSRSWDGSSDDELLDLLGTALAPAPRADASAGPALTVVAGSGGPASGAPRRPWRALAAVAAAVLVLVGVGVAVDGTTGDDDVTTPTSSPLDLAAAALTRLEVALAGPDDAAVARAVDDAQAALDRVDPDDRAPLAIRATALLTAAADRLAATASTTTTSSTTSSTATTATTAPVGGGSVPGTTPTTPTTDDHGGGDDDSGSGSDDSSGSGSSGSGSSGSGSSGSGSSGSGSDDSGSGSADD